MAYSYQQIFEAAYQNVDEEQALAAAELEAARISEDPYRVQEATKAMLKTDGERERLDRRAQEFRAQQQRQPQGNKWGLSKDEIDIARTHATGDRSITDEQRLELYARNKARYQQMRRDGSYRDDQGMVKR
jgi:hypothetical protein